MKFLPTFLSSAMVIQLDRLEDDRGFFARSFCRREFEAAGLNPNVMQCNVSRNRFAGTLRGMHYQAAPFEEAKLVRVTSGGVFDVIIDLRPSSATFTKWFGIELTATNHTALYVPEGFAHGFLTLADETEMFYQMANYYSPDHARGLRYNDPAFKITWPSPVKVISSKDEAYPDFVATDAELRGLSRR